MLLRLDLQLFSGEKTEKATPQKRRETRKKGEVAKSQEVSSALTLLVTFGFLMFGGKSLVEGFLGIYRHSYTEYMLWELSPERIELLFSQIVFDAIKLTAPILFVAMLAGVFASYIQVGFMFTPEAIKFKLEKLNPIQSAKQILSMKSVVEFLKSILKMVITGVIVYWLIWTNRGELFILGEKNIWDSIRVVGTLSIQIGLAIAITLVVLAVADYIYQKYEFEKKLRMSKQDIKDEYKKTEGDPFFKGQRRAKQRELAMNRMIQEVPKADVLITNPTHFAIAIRYDMETMDAPQVIAKGKDYIALKMKEIAKEHQIMTVENKPLARALFAAVEIGDAIPEDMFNAVGEILAYVYFQEGRYKGMMT